jgi:hypothetical protein
VNVSAPKRRALRIASKQQNVRLRVRINPNGLARYAGLQPPNRPHGGYLLDGEGKNARDIPAPQSSLLDTHGGFDHD